MIKLFTEDDYKFQTSADYASCVLDGVYFDSDAETILGHDIICVPKWLVIEEGIHSFEVADRQHGHQILTGSLYVWSADNRQRGLAVADGDSLGHCYAQRAFNLKMRIL